VRQRPHEIQGAALLGVERYRPQWDALAHRALARLQGRTAPQRFCGFRLRQKVGEPREGIAAFFTGKLDKLAARIIEAAKKGEREVAKLSAAGLGALEVQSKAGRPSRFD
jgi:hypothetical protein